MSVPPRLARVLYRSMLRSSRMGADPHVWGKAGAQAFVRQASHADEHLAMALPNSPVLVRRRLKSWFREPLSATRTVHDDPAAVGVDMDSPLETLRQSQNHASLLAMKHEGGLPIFKYGGVAALPNETIHFCFVEPRYLQLATRVWQSSSRQFLLMAQPTDNTATLLRFQTHMVLPNRMVAVSCLGGPRVFIRDTTSEAVPGELDPYHASQFNLAQASNLLYTATDFDWCPDKDDIDPASFVETREYLLHLLHSILPLQESSLKRTLEAFGLPPLDPEGFSYWVLRHTLAANDVKSRIQWSHKCFSTTKRLDFLVDELENILEYQSQQARRAA